MDPITTTVDLALDDADAAVRAALAEHGFGVLTEIDVAAVLKAKIDVDRAPLRVLGACNPHLAHAALQADPTASLLIPCNVVLEPEGGGTRISAVDPRSLLADPELAHLADDAAAKLRAALDQVGSSAS